MGVVDTVGSADVGVGVDVGVSAGVDVEVSVGVDMGGSSGVVVAIRSACPCNRSATSDQAERTEPLVRPRAKVKLQPPP